jgi:hypothetical protein
MTEEAKGFISTLVALLEQTREYTKHKIHKINIANVVKT